ncbi:MAG: TolC family protein [Candidatus Aminicenantes bacterium]|jgi:outer membrane protein TolC
MKRRIVPFLILVVFGMSALWSQPSEDNVFNLDQCISTALKHNPLILSSLEQHKASLARIHQAKAWTQPSLNYDSDLQPSFFNFKNAGETYLGVSQLFEFPGKQSVRGKIASRESDEILAEIDLLKLDLTFQVKQAFYGLLLAQEKLTYAERNRELAQDFLEKAELKYEAGDVAQVEVLRARVEAATAANEVRTATTDVRLAKATLNYLLSRKKYAPIEIVGKLKREPIQLDIDRLLDRALLTRPEMRKINVSIERENLQKKSAHMSYLPDLELGVNRHRVEGEGAWWDVTLSVPIPLFFWQPKKGEIAEAEANIRALQKEADHIKNTITLEVEEAYTNAVTAENQIRLFETEILNQAEEVYNMFLFSYQEGEIGSIELIAARRTLLESAQSYADALFNYEAALAALERSIGQPLKGESQ